METQRVLKTTRKTRTVTIFPWGNGHRVKYICTTNSRINSVAIASIDEYHENPKRAEIAFYEILLGAGFITNLPVYIVEARKELGRLQPTIGETLFMLGR